jgi:hypothetical protein
VMLVRNIADPATNEVLLSNGSKGVVVGFEAAAGSRGELVGTLERCLRGTMGRDPSRFRLEGAQDLDMERAFKELMDKGLDAIDRYQIPVTTWEGLPWHAVLGHAVHSACCATPCCVSGMLC